MARHTQTGRCGERYKSSFIRMGAIQILASILAVAFEIVALLYYNSLGIKTQIISTMGTGIWCGLFFFLAGSSAIYAGKKLSFNSILFALVASVVAFVLAIVLLSISIYILKYLIPKTNHNTFGILHVMLCVAPIMFSIPTIVQIIHLSTSVMYGSSSLTHVRIVSNPIEFTHNSSPVTQATVFLMENSPESPSQSSRQGAEIDYYTTNAEDSSATEICHKLPATTLQYKTLNSSELDCNMRPDSISWISQQRQLGKFAKETR